MALRLLTGLTGTGKSYQAILLVLADLSKGRKVFTNLEINVEDPNYIYLDELAVKSFIAYIGETFKDVENLTVKKQEIKDSIYHGASFYIDEAHLIGFRKKNEAIEDWFTIHRHFFQDVTVITQVPSNLHRDYLQGFHEHIEMLPQNKRLSESHMGYKRYENYKGERIETKHFKPDLDIFELYQAGNVEVGSSKDMKAIFYLMAGLFAGGVILYFAISSLFNTSDMDIVDVNKTVVVPSELNSLVVQEQNITIITESVLCSTDGNCNYLGNNMPFDKFLFYVLPRYEYKEKTVMTSSTRKGWRMVQYTLTM